MTCLWESSHIWTYTTSIACLWFEKLNLRPMTMLIIVILSEERHLNLLDLFINYILFNHKSIILFDVCRGKFIHFCLLFKSFYVNLCIQNLLKKEHYKSHRSIFLWNKQNFLPKFTFKISFWLIHFYSIWEKNDLLPFFLQDPEESFQNHQNDEKVAQ